VPEAAGVAAGAGMLEAVLKGREAEAPSSAPTGPVTDLQQAEIHGVEQEGAV